MRTEQARNVADDDDGLICAFDLRTFSPRGIDSFPEADTGTPLWLHFNLSDARATRWIEQQEGLPDEARELLLDADPRIHVEIIPEGVMAVLGDLHHDFRGDPEDFGVIRIFLDKQRMVSGRRHPLKSSDLLRRDLRSGEASDEVPLTPIALFERFVGKLAESFAATVAQLADDADDLEDDILAGRYRERGPALGRMRRLLARLRRHVNANRTALAPLPGRLAASYDLEERQRLRGSIERLDAVAQDLELVQERGRLLQEEIAGRIGDATNRNLFLLSIVTTTLLPITLITGIFGMNVGGLPWVNHDKGFWWVMVVIGLAVGTTLWILRRRRVL